MLHQLQGWRRQGKTHVARAEINSVSEVQRLYQRLYHKVQSVIGIAQYGKVM